MRVRRLVRFKLARLYARVRTRAYKRALSAARLERNTDFETGRSRLLGGDLH